MKCVISLFKVVLSVSRLDARAAMRPMTVLSPMETTMPLAEPCNQFHQVKSQETKSKHKHKIVVKRSSFFKPSSENKFDTSTAVVEKNATF